MDEYRDSRGPLDEDEAAGKEPNLFDDEVAPEADESEEHEEEEAV